MKLSVNIPFFSALSSLKTIKGRYIGLGSMLLLLATTGCKKSSNPGSQPDPQPTIEVKLAANGNLGNILTDKDGRTLYFFANDATTANTCTGGCEAFWPVFNVDNLTANNMDANLTLSDFTSITTQTGKKQVAYKGRPLYYFAPQVNGVNTLEAPGNTTGENVDGVWFVAKPDYTIMLTNAQLKGHDGKNYKSDYTEGNGNTIYFTDGRGITLYTFKNDRANKNNFTAADLSNNPIWPIYEQDKIVVPSNLDKTLFGKIVVFGKNQLTYKGWPLYYFGQDAMVMGANKGISFPAPGIWHVPVKDIAPAQPQ